MFKVSFSDIQKAREALTSYITPSSLSRSDSLSEEAGTKVFFKWESEHRIKSFKIRGALNKILSLSESDRKKGLITASAGNHAQGVALASQIVGIKARVVMMETASQVKIKATESFGAQVILQGKAYGDSYAFAESLQGDSVFIHPFADPLIIAGQGTAALEIFQSLPEVTSVITAIGGGGLISGVSLALKHLKPSCRIYGVVWDGTPAQCRNFHKVGEESCLCGKLPGPQQISRSGLTDGIAVKRPYSGMENIFFPLVEDIACVSEEEISRAIVKILMAEGRVVEGSGAAALAGLLKNKKAWNLGSHCCVILSGGNIDPPILAEVIKKYGREKDLI